MDLKDIPFIGQLTLGQFKEPFCLNEQSANTNLDFMERPLLAAFSPGYKVGIGNVSAPLDQRMTWALGAFVDTDSVGSGSTEEGCAVTGRDGIGKADMVAMRFQVDF